MNIIAIEARKMIVATMRTGLNIYDAPISGDSEGHQITAHQFQLREKLRID